MEMLTNMFACEQTKRLANVNTGFQFTGMHYIS